MQRIYSEIGVKPQAVDVHIYETEPAAVAQMLQLAETSARALGVPLDILETPYDDYTLFRLLAARGEAGQQSATPVQTLLVWPKRAGGNCGFDVAIPPLPTNLQ